MHRANESFFIKSTPHLFEVNIFGVPKVSAGIAELLWLDITQNISMPLATLTKDFVVLRIQQQINL